jgi:hypothetical protein
MNHKHYTSSGRVSKAGLMAGLSDDYLFFNEKITISFDGNNFRLVRVEVGYEGVYDLRYFKTFEKAMKRIESRTAKAKEDWLKSKRE